jgi:hypothetical protein
MEAFFFIQPLYKYRGGFGSCLGMERYEELLSDSAFGKNPTLRDSSVGIATGYGLDDWEVLV